MALITIASLVVLLLASKFTFGMFIDVAFVIFFALTAVVDIVLLIWTTIKVFQLSRSTNITEHHWFEKEKNRCVETSIRKLIRSTEFYFILQVFAVPRSVWDFDDYMATRNKRFGNDQNV